MFFEANPVLGQKVLVRNKRINKELPNFSYSIEMDAPNWKIAESFFRFLEK